MSRYQALETLIPHQQMFLFLTLIWATVCLAPQVHLCLSDSCSVSLGPSPTVSTLLKWSVHMFTVPCLHYVIRVATEQHNFSSCSPSLSEWWNFIIMTQILLSLLLVVIVILVLFPLICTCTREWFTHSTKDYCTYRVTCFLKMLTCCLEHISKFTLICRIKAVVCTCFIN